MFRTLLVLKLLKYLAPDGGHLGFVQHGCHRFITEFSLTHINTAPTITILVPLLFDEAVSMLKHIMEIVKGNSQFIEDDQTPVLASFIECLGHFSVHYWLNWVHEDDS